MRYLLSLVFVLALSVAFVACGGEGAGCAEPAADVAGEWEMRATPIEDTCDGEPGAPYTSRVTVTQDGNALTGQTPEGPMTGTICGDQIRMSASWTEAGVAQTVNLELTVSADGNSVEGSDTWTWTEGTQSCGGSESLRGTNLDATCSAWCAVIVECAVGSFAECVDGCVWWLQQAQAVSSECAGAYGSEIVCLAGLTCAEVDAWDNKVPPDAYPCKSAHDTTISFCLGWL